MKKILLLMFSLFLIACQADIPGELPIGDVIGNGQNNDQTNGQDNTQDTESNRDIARTFMVRAPTYHYDGSDLSFVDSQTNGVDTYVFSFESDNTGYGDRTGLATINVPTSHQTVVQVDNGRVISAVTDEYWNELEDEIVSRQFVKMKYEPVECEDDYPWQLWYEYNQALGEELEELTDMQKIERFYEKAPSTMIRSIQTVPRNEITCDACNVCLADFYYVLEVDTGYSALQLEEDGWQYIEPMSLSETNNALRQWVMNTETYSGNGRNLEIITSFIDSQMPQRIITTFGFETIDGGYGPNDVSMVEGINYHTIKVVVENGIIESAIIDNRWDVINQRLIN